MQVKWTKEDDEILRREWEAGTGTEQISKLLSEPRSKGSIIGRAQRTKLGLHSRAKGKGKTTTKEKKAEQIFKQPYSPVKKIEEWVDFPPADEADVLEAGRQVLEDWLAARDIDNGCRWPVGDKPLEDDFYCGMPKDDNCSYCKPHRKRAYQPMPKGSGHGFILRYIRG